MINMTNSEKEAILKENITEYHSYAIDAFNKENYNTATTLFFKAFAAMCDLLILRSENRIPSSHTDRFRLLENKHFRIYKIADRDFPFYQDSYTKKMTREAAEILKDDVEKLASELSLNL